MFYNLIKSAEFWLAIVALAQTILLNYLGVPQDIWQGINAILLVMIGALTADRVSNNLVRGIRETMLELRKMDK
jgi:hypothetical protein